MDPESVHTSQVSRDPLLMKMFLFVWLIHVGKSNSISIAMGLLDQEKESCQALFAFSAQGFNTSAVKQQEGYTILELPHELSGKERAPTSAESGDQVVAERDAGRFVLWQMI